MKKRSYKRKSVKNLSGECSIEKYISSLKITLLECKEDGWEDIKITSGMGDFSEPYIVFEGYKEEEDTEMMLIHERYLAELREKYKEKPEPKKVKNKFTDGYIIFNIESISAEKAIEKLEGKKEHLLKKKWVNLKIKYENECFIIYGKRPMTKKELVYASYPKDYVYLINQDKIKL